MLSKSNNPAHTSSSAGGFPRKHDRHDSREDEDGAFLDSIEATAFTFAEKNPGQKEGLSQSNLS